MSGILCLLLVFISGCGKTTTESPAVPEKIVLEEITEESVINNPIFMETPSPITDHTVTWVCKKKVGATHTGTITIKKGQLLFDKDGTLTGGSCVIDMQTIVNTDLDSKAMQETLVEHLESTDFFDTKTYPESLLNITKAEKKNDTQYKITADLTIKNQTHPITFDATVIEKEGKRIATATITIDRSKWDIRYGSGSFFSDLGDNLIEDTITFTIELHV